MHAFLVIGNNKEDLKTKAGIFAQKYSRQIFEYQINKIEQVRELTKFVSLGFSDKIVVLINNIDQASPEAQNAFLKPLEEPQKNVVYVLSAQSSDAVIPTVLSRVEVVQIASDKRTPSADAKTFLLADKAAKLKYISKIKTRDKALEFIEDLIYFAHSNFESNTDMVHILEQLDLTRRALKANGNIGLQLTRLVTKI